MKLVPLFFFAILLAASASADGFLLSTNAIASERRAALEALCGRLEARGLARVPAGAKWCDTSEGNSRPYRSACVNDIGFENGHESEHAWLLREGADGTNDYMNADGYCFKSVAALSRPARLSRDVALIAGRLERAAAANAQSAATAKGEDKDEDDYDLYELECFVALHGGFGGIRDKGKSPRLALLFAAQLFRAGHEDGKIH